MSLVLKGLCRSGRAILAVAIRELIWALVFDPFRREPLWSLEAVTEDCGS